MKTTVRSLAIVALVILAGLRSGTITVPDVPVIPGVEIAAPSAELQALVEPIKAKLEGHNKAGQVAACYAAWADVIERDGGNVVTDTRVFEIAHRNTLILYGFDKDPMIGAEIDDAIGTHLGLNKDNEGWTPIPLGQEEAKKLAAVLRAISWSGG